MFLSTGVIKEGSQAKCLSMDAGGQSDHFTDGQSMTTDDRLAPGPLYEVLRSPP